jgi:hypothetical protein
LALASGKTQELDGLKVCSPLPPLHRSPVLTSRVTLGTAILIAVFLVAIVTAGNNYTKELQFRALEKSSQRDERCSVVRDGVIERINPIDLVVGDIIILQVPPPPPPLPVMMANGDDVVVRRFDPCGLYSSR